MDRVGQDALQDHVSSVSMSETVLSQVWSLVGTGMEEAEKRDSDWKEQQDPDVSSKVWGDVTRMLCGGDFWFASARHSRPHGGQWSGSWTQHDLEQTSGGCQ